MQLSVMIWTLGVALIDRCDIYTNNGVEVDEEVLT